MRKLTDQEVHYFQTALAMCGISASKFSSEIILRCFYESKKMGGNFDLLTASKIKVEVEEKYREQTIQPSIMLEDLDKFYDKAVEIFQEKKKEDELATKLILYELKDLIETKKQEFK